MSRRLRRFRANPEHPDKQGLRSTFYHAAASLRDFSLPPRYDSPFVKSVLVADRNTARRGQSLMQVGRRTETIRRSYR